MVQFPEKTNVDTEMLVKALKLLSETPELIAKLGLLPNAKMKTMGGQIWWNELAEYEGWRVQRLWTGHCRILDPDNVRQAWGGEKAIMDFFEKILKN